MDVLIIPCPNCRHELRLPDQSLLGRFGRCPSCRHKFVMEDQTAESADTSIAVPGTLILEPGPDLSDAGETIAMNVGDSLPECVAANAMPRAIGRYDIKQLLGQGAMGAVYLAFDSRLHRDVALKVPKFSEADGQEPIERFYREARMAATLSHPNICPVYDIGEADGTRYIALAYIDGRPLTDYIRRDRPQPLRHIAKTICRVALAVHEAHRRQIVHRDLKPDNIMIDNNRQPVIMDFGLARRLFKRGDDRLTHSGALVGSPAYMSPEQVEGDPEQITAASDIYSLGVVLYELLTGARPFAGSVGSVMGQILRDPPRPPSDVRPDIDDALESICLKMMAKQPSDRYASMDGVAHALAGYLHGSRPDESRRLPTIDLNAIHPESLEQVLSQAQPSDDSVVPRVRQLLARHHYEQAVAVLHTLPEDRRTPELQQLLAEALDKRNQVQMLAAGVNRAKRRRDFEEMADKLQRLLDLKPRNRECRQLLSELQRKGFGRDKSRGGRVES